MSLTAEMGLAMQPGADRRRENLPTASEVAAIVPDVRPGTRSTQDLRLSLRAPADGLPCSGSRRVQQTYLPLHYVLLFPYGEPGWSPDLRLTDDLPGPRADEAHVAPLPRPPPVHPPERLQHHLPCEAAVPAVRGGCRCHDRAESLDVVSETTRDRIWADMYKGLADYLDRLGTGEDREARVLGRRVVLPSSHAGSERAMRAAFMDAMAVTGRFKKPHLFLTMTTNPKWPEIQQELHRG